MSSPVRAAVDLARDPRLPRRDDLLDDDAVGSLLADLLAPYWGRPAEGCERVRAKYRMGESLRATYRLGDGASSRLVSARMFPGEKAPVQYVRARDSLAAQGADPHAVLFDEPTSTVFWVFPQDRKLWGLQQLATPPPALRDVFGRPWAHSELVAYTPEKAATARCLDELGATTGFAKVQTDDEGRHSVAALRAARRGLPDRGALRLPEAVGYLPERHMALFSAAPGRPLHQLQRAAVPEAMTALGEALSVLHRQPTEGFARFTRLDPGQLAAAAGVVSAARPDLAPLAEALAHALLSTVPGPGPGVLLHGDLHPKNVLVHEAGVSLVDLDQAGVGPAAAELGGTLARLWCPRPGDEIDADTAAAAGRALLASYHGAQHPDDLRWYAAAALLVERAVRAISRVDVAAIADLERVLLTARRWVGQRGGIER